MYEDAITDALNELQEALAVKQRRIDEYEAWMNAHPQGDPGGLTSCVGGALERVKKAQARLDGLNARMKTG